MYTQTDLESVQNAIIELAQGARVVKFITQGKTTEYSETDLASLKKLRDEISRELRVSSKSFIRTRTRKGL